MAPPTAVVDGG
ncbi:hypothetical protein L195_g053978, partial [Trifolium pratense]